MKKRNIRIADTVESSNLNNVGAGFHPCPKQKHINKPTSNIVVARCFVTNKKYKYINRARGIVPLQKDSAITLISLIITIIILLILAGLTLNMVIGDNGIISKAIIAKEKTDASQSNEERKIEEIENTIEEYKIPYNRENDKKIYIIPTINTVNDPCVFSSGYYSNYYPHLAFDKNIKNGSIESGYNDSPWAIAQNKDIYLGYAYGIEVEVIKAEYTPRYDNATLNQNLKSYKYQYSDDFINWNDATEEINLEKNNYTETISTEIKNAGKHRFWRIYIISNYGDTYTAINELQFYCNL